MAGGRGFPALICLREAKAGLARSAGAAFAAVALVSGCAQFEDGLAAMSGRGGTIARSDQVQETAQRAARLAPAHPAPAWETVFPEEAPDLIEFLDEDRLLVGTVEVGAYLGVPSFKHVHLYNARDGKRIWQAERPDLLRGHYSLLTSRPLIVLGGANADETVLLGLDPSSGARRWHHEFKPVAAYALPTAGNRIAVLTQEGNAARVTGYALDTGAIAWSRELRAGKVGGPGRISASEDDVYVVGARLSRLRGGDGAEAWSVEAPELEDDSVSLAVYPEGLLVWSAGSMALLDSVTGKTRWRNTVPQGGIKMIGSLDGRLYRVVTPDVTNLVTAPTASDSVQALDMASGALRWTREVDGTIVSNLALDADRVMFTVEEALVALRARDGAPAYRHRLPPSFQEGSPTEFDPPGQPDLVAASGARLHLSRESAGVLAASVEDGRLLWVQSNASFPYSRPQRFGMLKLAMDQYGIRVPSAGWVPAYTASRPNAQLQAHQRRIESIVSEGRAASRRAQSLAAQPGARLDPTRREAIRGELAQARLSSEIALGETQRQIAYERTQANLAFAESLAGLASVIEPMLKNAAVQGLVSRLQLELGSASGLHRSTFQSRYHVRPFREHVHQKVRGVTLVELQSGGRTDLVFGPTVDAVVDYGLDLPHVVMSPSGGRLIAVGVGLRPERYESYVKGKVRIPRPSLLAYDTSRMRFVSGRAAAEAHSVATSAQAVDGEAALIAAARKGNGLKVRRLLDRGVDPNPRRPTRFAPLIVAAENGYAEVVRLLLSRGAKADYAFGGRSAIDFAKDPAVRRILSAAGATPAGGN